MLKRRRAKGRKRLTVSSDDAPVGFGLGLSAVLKPRAKSLMVGFSRTNASAAVRNTSRFTNAASEHMAVICTLFTLSNNLPVGRLGIAATRKLGGAVERNRAKRLIREVFRRNKLAPGFDIVVIPKRELLDASLTALETEFRHTLERSLRRRFR